MNAVGGGGDDGVCCYRNSSLFLDRLHFLVIKLAPSCMLIAQLTPNGNIFCLMTSWAKCCNDVCIRRKREEEKTIWTNMNFISAAVDVATVFSYFLRARQNILHAILWRVRVQPYYMNIMLRCIRNAWSWHTHTHALHGTRIVCLLFTYGCVFQHIWKAAGCLLLNKASNIVIIIIISFYSIKITAIIIVVVTIKT